MIDDLFSREEAYKAFSDYLNRNIIGEISSRTELSIGEIASVIKSIPTAFDKEKVIEELREMQSHSKLCKNQCGFTSTEYFDYMGAEVAYGTAIEIVEKGGIE